MVPVVAITHPATSGPSAATYRDALNTNEIAEPLTAVVDREVVSAVGELNPHRDAARACADDRDLGFDTRHLCNHYIYSVMRNGAFFGRS